MKKLLFFFVLLSPCLGFAATCPTVAAGSSAYCDITVSPTDPWGNGTSRKFWRVVPTGYVADGTATLILALNGSTLASSNIAQGFIQAHGTTGWFEKCAAVSPKCVVIAPEPLPASRYHIESISCDGATCTVHTRELNPNSGSNITVANLAGACSGANSLTAVASTYVDVQTLTFPKVLTCAETSPSAFAEVGSQNGSFSGLMRNEPSNAVDDVGFLTAILKEQMAILLPNPNSVFCIGWSAGAFACSRFAGERPDQIAAIALAEGSIGTQHYNPSHTYGTYGAETDVETNFTDPNSPMNVLAFSGTSDTTVLNCGGGVHHNFYQQNSLYQTLQFWVTANHSTTVPAYPCTVGTVVAPVSASCSAARTTAATYTVTASPQKVVRSAGSFVTDGYATNDYVAFRGFTNPINNGAVCKVSSISTTSIANDTLNFNAANCSLASEGPTAATLDGTETIVFTVPSAPATQYGFATSPPNNGVRWFNMGSTTYQQADCSITGSLAGTSVTTNTLGACWSTAAQLACVPGAIAVGSGTIQPRPYLPTASNQISWLASGGDDGTDIQAYSLNGGGHTYWGGYSTTGATYTLSASGSTITRSSGSFTTDAFATNDIVGMSTSGGWTANAGTRCTATVTSATVLTLASCSAALVDEVTGTSAYVTDNVIDGMNSSITGAQNETDVAWTFFQAHKKAAAALTHRGRSRSVVGTKVVF